MIQTEKIISTLSFIAILCSVGAYLGKSLAVVPVKKCHITHILKCDTVGCTIMCIDGTTCRKDGYPIEWGTTVECR